MTKQHLTTVLTLVALCALTPACYSSAGVSGYVPMFDPNPEAALVVGRDCSFHLAGLAFRDLATRQAARNALDGANDAALAGMTSRLVYPAPFEVCIEVEGIAVRRDALTAK